MKKLAIILLTIIFLLSAFSLLPVKKISANTGPDISLCAAEPWDWSRYNKGGSGSSGGKNQGISNPTNHSVTKHSSNSAVQATSYQREHRYIIKQRNQPFGWRWRFLLFAKMIFNR